MNEHDQSLEKALPKASRESAALLKDRLSNRFNVINSAAASVDVHVLPKRRVSASLSSVVEKPVVAEDYTQSTHIDPSLQSTPYIDSTLVYSSDRPDARIEAARAEVEDVFAA